MTRTINPTYNELPAIHLCWIVRDFLNKDPTAEYDVDYLNDHFGLTDGKIVKVDDDVFDICETYHITREYPFDPRGKIRWM